MGDNGELPTAFDAMASKIRLAPYAWQNPKGITPREWLYGTHLCRGYLSVRVAAGGVGKTSLNLADALAMASGKPLLGYEPFGIMNVFYWGEDPRDELKRRLEATRQHYRLEPDDIEGLIFLHSARDLELKTAVARGRNGLEIVRPVHDALVREFRENEIDIAMIDPFAASHSVSENDNAQIAVVASQWGHLAGETGTAIDLTHHLRKGNGQERTVEDARGGKALIDTGRDTQLLLKMTSEEATAMGIEEAEIWRYFRVADGKANMAPPANKSDWFRLESTSLDNGTKDRPPDFVGVVTRWVPPTLFGDVSKAKIDCAMRALKARPGRRHAAATEWAGHTIGAELDIDTSEKPGKARVEKMMKEWIKTGALQEFEDKDANRLIKPFVRLGNWEFSTPDPDREED